MLYDLLSVFFVFFYWDDIEAAKILALQILEPVQLRLSVCSSRMHVSFLLLEDWVCLLSHICLFLFLMMGYFWSTFGSWWVILKIRSNSVFILSYSPATSFHSCLPGFTLTGTVCLPRPTPAGLTGADEHVAHWITMSGNGALKKKRERGEKKEGLGAAVVVLPWERGTVMVRSCPSLPSIPHPLQTPYLQLSCLYANALW